MKPFAVLVVAALAAGCAAPGAAPVDPRESRWDRATPEQREWALRNPESAGFSPEEAQWVRQNPDAARALGELDPAERRELRQRYEALPPEMQERVRQNPDSIPDLAR